MAIIDAEQQRVNDLYRMIRTYGFKISKDELGYYFDNGPHKFSIIKTGPFMKVYYNVLNVNHYELQDRLNTTMRMIDCLEWILKKIQREISNMNRKF